MKNIIYYTFIVAFASLVSACSVVDLDPSNKYSKDYGYQSQANVELYLNSFYPMIYDFGQFGSNALGGAIPACLTDSPIFSNTEEWFLARETVILS